MVNTWLTSTWSNLQMNQLILIIIIFLITDAPRRVPVPRRRGVARIFLRGVFATFRRFMVQFLVLVQIWKSTIISSVNFQKEEWTPKTPSSGYAPAMWFWVVFSNIYILLYIFFKYCSLLHSSVEQIKHTIF